MHTINIRSFHKIVELSVQTVDSHFKTWEPALQSDDRVDVVRQDWADTLRVVESVQVLELARWYCLRSEVGDVVPVGCIKAT